MSEKAWAVYLPGAVHSDWRERIARGVDAARAGPSPGTRPGWSRRWPTSPVANCRGREPGRSPGI